MYPQRSGILGGYEPDFKNYPQSEHDNFDDDNLNLHSLGFGTTELSEKDWNFIFKKRYDETYLLTDKKLIDQVKIITAMEW